MVGLSNWLTNWRSADVGYLVFATATDLQLGWSPS